MKKIWLGFWRFVWRSLLFVLGVSIVLNIIGSIYQGNLKTVVDLLVYLFFGWVGVFICIKWSVTPISPRKSKGGVATKPEPDKAGLLDSKISTIKLGFKSINHISLTDKDMHDLPDKELNKRLDRITRVGNFSYGLGILGLILSPLYIWIQSSDPNFTMYALIILVIIILAVGLFFVFIGRSIAKSNDLLKTKLWLLTILTLPLASGIIPLILFIYGIIGIHNSYKLTDEQLAKRVKHNKGNDLVKNYSEPKLATEPKEAEKIDLIKLGFKKLHGATLTNREMYTLTPKALKKYLKAGMK